jgi:hypothetical protein
MPTPTETRSVTYVDWADYPTNEAALLIGAVWGESPGSPITISYSFGETDSVWSSNPGDYAVGNSEPYQGYQALNEEERDAFRRAFDAWSEVANITFVEIDETATSVGDIRVAISSEVSLENFDAWGYYPAVTGAAGDIWVAPEIGTALEIVPGDYFQFVAVHEIGHALGLAHPFADPFYTEKPALSLAFDN